MKNVRLPSEERVWDQYYMENAYSLSNEIPDNSTLWDILEEEMMKYDDVPALTYMKQEISRETFRNEVYTWARTFRTLGVEPDEVVPIYSAFFPGVGAMACALNIIGATSYFLKLAINKEALEQEISKSKVAVVYDGMFKNVREVFEQDVLKKVVVATPADAMPSPKKEIVSFMSYFQNKKQKSLVPKNDKYIWFDEAYKIANYYTGNVKVPFKKNRNTFITSSSGTTIGGIVKGTVATNEGAIAQLRNGYYAKMGYHAGKKCFNNLPLTASTSLMALFLLAEYHGMNVVAEPRISRKNFFPQIMENKPQVSIMTGSYWIQFFRDLENHIDKSGKIPSLEFFDMPIIGGEGCIPEDLDWMNGLMKLCGAKVNMISGSGSSEVFSVLSAHKPGIILKEPVIKKPVIDVGIPYPGMDIKIVDENENELSYNQRGELWARGGTVMKEYYLKSELTEKVKTKDGWIKTGDIYDIDQNGLLYIYGRMNDCIKTNTGEKKYLFDIGNEVRENENIKYCIINNMPTEENHNSLVAHIVFGNSVNEKNKVLKEIDEYLALTLPEGVEIIGYKEHDIEFPISPTTAKIDRNALMKETEYIRPTSYEEIEFISIKREDNGLYKVYNKTEQNKHTKKINYSR